MNALVLEEVGKFQLREIPKPVPGDRDVLIRVGAVGICGTDLHIFQGLLNLSRDSRGQPIPLGEKPQILGHEFCGTVEAAGGKVKKVKPGDRVVVDQVLNCASQGRSQLCEFCETGDSHQCEFSQELGVTGVPGALSDHVSVPEANVVLLPPTMPDFQGAIIEPLGCVLHASDRMEAAHNRYSFEGQRRIRYVVILGAGPSGLLFLQYLRKIRNFDGEIFVADMRASKLQLAEKLGGTPLDVRKTDLAFEIQQRTHGQGAQYLIEASGVGEVFDCIPLILRRQGTLLLYGAGHSGRDIGCLTPLQVMEHVLVTTAGASGGFDADGTPTIYRRAMEYIRDGKIDAESLISHRYRHLSQMQRAFSEDSKQQNYIKGMLLCGGTS